MGTLLDRKLAVVTGASTGIGFALANQCVEHDFDLVICSHDDQGIQEAAKHLSATGSRWCRSPPISRPTQVWRCSTARSWGSVAPSTRCC